MCAFFSESKQILKQPKKPQPKVRGFFRFDLVQKCWEGVVGTFLFCFILGFFSMKSIKIKSTVVQKNLAAK